MTTGRVAGKRVLVTGAARGMGRSHAVRLAQEGADLILVDLCESLPGLEYPLATRADLDQTARLVRSHGRTAVTAVADVRDAEAMRAVVADGVAGPPDIGPIYGNALPVQVVEARDISSAVLFLVSDESRYVTGLEFKVDAGVTIR